MPRLAKIARAASNTSRRLGALGGSAHPLELDSDGAFAGVAAETDGFVAQVVHGLDPAHAATFRPHQNRMRDRAVAAHAHAG